MWVLEATLEAQQRAAGEMHEQQTLTLTYTVTIRHNLNMQAVQDTKCMQQVCSRAALQMK